MVGIDETSIELQDGTQKLSYSGREEGFSDFGSFPFFGQLARTTQPKGRRCLNEWKFFVDRSIFLPTKVMFATKVVVKFGYNPSRLE